MRIELIFAWYDFWIGLFYDREKRIIYFFPIPTIGLKIQLRLTPHFTKKDLRKYSPSQTIADLGRLSIHHFKNGLTGMQTPFDYKQTYSGSKKQFDKNMAIFNETSKRLLCEEELP